MDLTLEELKELGIDWEEFCDLTGTNIWAKNEGLMDDKSVVELSVKDFLKLMGE